MEKRIPYIDVVAGIMITWMILGHCCYFSNYSFPFYKFLGFYMPWFFYKSGMLFSSKNPKLQLTKDAKKLLGYFVVFSIIGWLIWSFCCIIDGSVEPKLCVVKSIKLFLHRGCFAGNGPLWFLISLFLVRLLSNILINK